MLLNLKKNLIVFDIESTGTQLVKDKIIEICLLKVFTDNTTEVRTFRINPGIPIPKEVSKIHGIFDEDVKDKPFFKDIAQDLLTFIGNSDLAGYNSNKFDVPFLIEEFLRAGFEFQLKGRKLIDVQNIFHKMEPRTLKAAYKFYCQKELINAHSAEADTIATFEVLKAQIQAYSDTAFEDKEGHKTTPIKNDMQALHDFSYNNKNADLVGHIVFDDKDTEMFNFGKHKGKYVADVFKNEPSYYDWIMKSDFPQMTKKLCQYIKIKSQGTDNVHSKLFDF